MAEFKLVCGDCQQRLLAVPDNKVDLIVTDPPYTMTRRGKSCRPNWMPHDQGNNVFDGELPDPRIWMRECHRVLKDGTHFYTFTNTVDLRLFLNAADDVGFKLHNVISMVKDTGMPSRWYLKQTELILFFRKGYARPINDLTSRDNIRVVMPKARTNKLHLTQKPLALIELLVTNSSEPRQVVLDPFMGSGTTGVAALKHGRKFIGMEMSPSTFGVARSRITEFMENRNEDIGDIGPRCTPQRHGFSPHGRPGFADNPLW